MQLEEPDGSKEWAPVSDGVDYVVVSCKLPPSEAHPNASKGISHISNKDVSEKSLYNTKLSRNLNRFIFQDCWKIMFLHTTIPIAIWCLLKKTSLPIYIICSKMALWYSIRMK